MWCGDCQSPPYHVVSRPEPTAMLTQNWCEESGCGNGVGWTPKPKAFWRSLVAMWGGKNIAYLFKNKFPINYRPSSKNQLKFPGICKPILGNESVVSLWSHFTVKWCFHNLLVVSIFLGAWFLSIPLFIVLSCCSRKILLLNQNPFAATC